MGANDEQKYTFLGDLKKFIRQQKLCPNKAFSAGTRAWGLQIHPEVTESIIRDWCAWTPATASTVEILVANFYREEQAYRLISQRVIGKFIGLAL